MKGCKTSIVIAINFGFKVVIQVIGHFPNMPRNINIRETAVTWPAKPEVEEVLKEFTQVQISSDTFKMLFIFLFNLYLTRMKTNCDQKSLFQERSGQEEYKYKSIHFQMYFNKYRLNSSKSTWKIYFCYFPT